MAYKLDFETSKQYAELVGAKPRECYSNGIMVLVAAANDVGKANVVYCEGYAASSDLGIPIQHGWVEITIDGKTKIVDPTWYSKNETIVYKSLLRLTVDDIDGLFKRRKSIKTPVTDFYTQHLVDKGLLKRSTANEFIEMLNDFHRELNEVTKTIGDRS